MKQCKVRFQSQARARNCRPVKSYGSRLRSFGGLTVFALYGRVSINIPPLTGLGAERREAQNGPANSLIFFLRFCGWSGLLVIPDSSKEGKHFAGGGDFCC